jgi:ATP-dependent DNA ligase
MIQFFYPPQPTRIWPNSSLLLSLDHKLWDAEIKYNGWRLLLMKLDQDKILLYNRHSTIIDIDWKPFFHAFKDIPVGTVFDGELLDRRTKDLKNIVVLWDCCFYDGKDLRLKSLKERRPFLDHFSTAPARFSNSQTFDPKTQKATPNGGQVYKVQQFSTNFRDLYNSIDQRNDPIEEGIVIKNKLSLYKYSAKRGTDVTEWLKVKKIGDHATVKKPS